MKRKIIGIFVCTLLIAAVLPTQGTTLKEQQKNEGLTDYSYLFQNDAIMPPEIENAGMSSSPGPGYYDLSEYMVGTLAIGIIFLESDGSIDPNTENWVQQEKNDALAGMGLAGGYLQWYNWFQNENMYFHSMMTYTEVNTVNISYEPIIHPSAITDDSWEKLYVAEAMDELGYSSGDWMKRVRDYSNYLRDNIETLPGVYGTDWAFTVFLVDNSNDADGLFSDGYHAYAYLGGPFTVCPHLRPGGPPGPMLKEVFIHEMGHIFYATDEYNGQTDYSGYLNQPDVEGSGCIMDNLALCLSSGTKLQVGWRDTDADGKADILDTEPETILNAYTPDPTSDPTPTYTGSATVQPMTNNNPNGPGNDVTTNTIGAVEFRVDGGTWTYVYPDDGYYDDPVEAYTFTTPPLSGGTHTIEARAHNSLGNVDQTPASDTITIVPNNAPNKPSTPSGPTSGKVGQIYTYSTITVDPDGDKVKYGWDWDGDSTVDEWDDNGGNYYTSGVSISTSHSWPSQGTYNIKVMAEDINGAQGVWSDSLPVTMPLNQNQVSGNSVVLKFLQILSQILPLSR